MAVQSRLLQTDQLSDSGALIAQLQALQSAFESSEKKVYQQALEASERRYRDLFETVLTGIYRTTPDGTVVLANPALQRMLGFSTDEQPVIHRVDGAAYRAALFTDGEVRAMEGVWIRKDGAHITVRETARAVRDGSGVTIFYEGIVEDITAEKRNELFDRGCQRILEMVARNEPLDEILRQIAHLVEEQSPGRFCSISLCCDGRLHPLATSPLTSRFADKGIPMRAGYGCLVHAAKCRRTVIVPNVAESDVFSRVQEVVKSLGIGASWSTPFSTQGEVRGVISVFAPEPTVPDAHEIAMSETVSRLAAVAIEHRWLYDNLHRQATKDSLTGLPNRSVFESTLAQNLRDNARLALLWIDLDRFKEVNDSLGHRIGDALIRQVAGRLSECAGKATLLARIGGDEFAVILHALAAREDAEACARKIAAELQAPFQVEEYELFVTASIGISIYPEHACTAVELQQKADTAMYRAKSRGKNGYAFFEDHLESGARARLETETSLRRALQNGELKLFYQPQVDLQGRMVGMEALLRWFHPKRGVVSPVEFIPIAEETGLIVPIGSWVIREACRQCAEWQKQGIDVKVAVNVSALQFYFSDLLDIVRTALDACALKPESLELELTESL
ncbi:MAG TPA: diguanylate cyclase, partial [Bryobacteraceae bacterium]|nr:diguanylate cyclase [Bryobacteraceae bacterium]